MPTPFFSTLPRSARQALPIIQAGVARGLSSRAITQTIRDAGIRISRGRSVLPAMRALRQLEVQGRNVRYVSGANRINPRRLPAAVVELKTAYRYRLVLEGINAAGQVERRYRYFSTDDANLTPDMIKDKAREAYERNRVRYDLNNIDITIEHGEQRADLLDFTAMPGGRFARP
jgi:hypothetical protein